ncbi:MAG: N-acetylglucosamine kinase [Propionibacteriaceae bacterium]
MRALVVGVDAGGTSTRVGVGRRDGSLLAVVAGPGANPNAVGLRPAAHRIGELVRSALAQADVAAIDVSALTIAMAGASRVAGSTIDLAAVRRDVAPAGLGAVPEVVLDVAGAFSAGSPADAGPVLVAGTGSIAAEVVRGQVRRRAGGWGWLLGDEGGGFWLGREAVRHALRAPDDHGPLATAVRQAYGADDGADLLAAAYAAEPHRLARLGAVVAASAADDPAAAELVEQAATHLVALVDQLRCSPTAGDASPGLPPGLQPIVLAGSVLTSDGPVGRRVRALLAAVGRPTSTAGPAVVGPVWLAARSLGPLDPEIHRRFRAAAGVGAA